MRHLGRPRSRPRPDHRARRGRGRRRRDTPPGRGLRVHLDRGPPDTPHGCSTPGQLNLSPSPRAERRLEGASCADSEACQGGRLLALRKELPIPERATLIISALTSTPATPPSDQTRSAARRVATPVPQATSSTLSSDAALPPRGGRRREAHRSPGRGSARSTPPSFPGGCRTRISPRPLRKVTARPVRHGTPVPSESQRSTQQGTAPGCSCPTAVPSWGAGATRAASQTREPGTRGRLELLPPNERGRLGGMLDARGRR